MRADRHLTIKNMAESERPREKLLQHGVNGLSNSELLAILIRTGTKDFSAIDLAQRILAFRHDGIQFLTDCTIQELSEIKGIGISKACQIIASIELGKRIAKAGGNKKNSIQSPKDAADIVMEEMRYYKKEYFKIIILNTKNEIISIENISVGSLNASLVHPREVFVEAIRKSGAAIILLHNHPSGNSYPSSEDISITNRLVEAGKIIGIEVLDHIIIGDGKYTSLKELSII
ncbi:MAG: RadC family protein [Bacillota bacterium]